MAALSQLTLGRRAEAVGLAWTAMHAADDLQPQLAFEWTLSTNAATRAHVGPVSDSVTDVMLRIGISNAPFLSQGPRQVTH